MAITDRGLRDWARLIKRDVHALYLARRDPRVPWYAKALAALIAGYALSPIDLIPDFIPVLGYLDDVILVPLGDRDCHPPDPARRHGRASSDGGSCRATSSQSGRGHRCDRRVGPGRRRFRRPARAFFRALKRPMLSRQDGRAEPGRGLGRWTQLGPGWGVAIGVDKSDQYRRFAQECLEMARTSDSEQTRGLLVQMAQVWFRLAEARANEDRKARRDADTDQQSD